MLCGAVYIILKVMGDESWSKGYGASAVLKVSFQMMTDSSALRIRIAALPTDCLKALKIKAKIFFNPSLTVQCGEIFVDKACTRDAANASMVRIIKLVIRSTLSALFNYIIGC